MEKEKEPQDQPVHPTSGKPDKPDVQPLDGDQGPGVPEDPGKGPNDPPPPGNP